MIAPFHKIEINNGLKAGTETLKDRPGLQVFLFTVQSIYAQGPK